MPGFFEKKSSGWLHSYLITVSFITSSVLNFVPSCEELQTHDNYTVRGRMNILDVENITTHILNSWSCCTRYHAVTSELNKPQRFDLTASVLRPATRRGSQSTHKFPILALKSRMTICRFLTVSIQETTVLLHASKEANIFDLISWRHIY